MQVNVMLSMMEFDTFSKTMRQIAEEDALLSSTMGSVLTEGAGTDAEDSNGLGDNDFM